MIPTKTISNKNIGCHSSVQKQAALRILLLTANPRDTCSLRLAEEIRNIEEAVRAVGNSQSIQIINKGAVRIKDFLNYLVDYQPHILHFSGHGSHEKGLVFEDDAGNTQLISADALERLFQSRALTRNIRCVFLNACYSHTQAEAIFKHIDCVVGMKKSIQDRAAVQFSARFYETLAKGCSFPIAYEVAQGSLLLSNSRETLTPELLTRSREADPFSILVINSEESFPSTDHRSKHSQSFGFITITGKGNSFTPVQSDSHIIITHQ